MYCEHHDTQCPVHPAAEEREDATYMCIGGNVCLPWTRMGSQDGWLHECSIAFVIWISDMMFMGKPDGIIQEYTVDFDAEPLANIFEKNGYFVESCSFCPTDFGIPARRPRHYMLARKLDTLQVQLKFDIPTMTTMFYHELVADGRIYFRMPSKTVLKELNQLAESRHLPKIDEDSGLTWNCRELVTPCQRERLLIYEDMARTDGQSFMCVQLGQNPGFWKKADSACPTLMRNSMIYGLHLPEDQGEEPKVDRILTSYEHLGVLGIPVLLPRDHPLHEKLPEKLRYWSDLTNLELRHLTGNGMHLAQIGSVIILFFMGTRKMEQPTAPLTLRRPAANGGKRPAAAAARSQGRVVKRKPSMQW